MAGEMLDKIVKKRLEDMKRVSWNQNIKEMIEPMYVYISKHVLYARFL